MIDGVHKYFLLYHEGNSMHVEGEMTLDDIAFMAMRKLTCEMTPHERNVALASLCKSLRKCFKSWEKEEPTK